MGHEFEMTDEMELAADPQAVWQAIATGPGQDCWFLGRNRVGAATGEAISSDFGDGAIPAMTITDREPGRRLRGASAPGPDGRFLATEYPIDADRAGSTVLGIVSSGFLPGDDWEAEFDAMRAGGCIFRASLREYVAHFAGRHGVPLTVFGPPVGDWAAAWATMDAALGLHGPPERGAPVRIELPGREPVRGQIYAANEQVRGVRAADALYRVIQGLPGVMLLAHVVFAGDTREAGWQAWLDQLYI